MTDKTRWTAGAGAALLLAGAVGFSLTHSAARADPIEPLVVTGELSFEGGTLPERSVITVRLADVSLMDAPSVELTRQELTGAQPARFELRTDRAGADARRTLAVSADVYVDGKLRWITDTRNTVPSEAPVPTLHLSLIAVP